MLRQLLQDEAGFIVSAELVLVATILVIGLIVGLSQVQHAVVEELNDVAHAIGSLNQSYKYTGFSTPKRKPNGNRSIGAVTFGSMYKDNADSCDSNCDEIACDAPGAECARIPN